MTNFVYLRVSTSSQDVDNQKLGILDYCHRLHLSQLRFIEDTSSGKLAWQSRPIGRLLEQAKPKDHLIVAEVSRLGRSTLQVLEILEYAAKKEVGSPRAYFTKLEHRFQSAVERSFHFYLNTDFRVT